MAVGAHQAGGLAVAEEHSWRVAVFAVFAVTIARLVWLASAHADLYPDEAQYWLWSLHPAWGYYSKPPLVAWIIALTTSLGRDDEFAVRFAAPLLHFATALVIYHLARRLYDARVAQWSAIVYATLPGVSVSAIIMSTDAPLLLCWSIALYAFVRAREPGSERWWWAVGMAAGVGLLAKYAMAYWLISALLFLLLFRDERRHLRRFFAALALALAIYAPNFVWNLTHHFVSYRHTRDNASLHGSLIHPDSFVEFFASQFAVFGPLLFGALILIVINSRRRLAERRAALLATFALPTLGMMLVVSFLSRAQPNWSAPTYISSTVLVVAWLQARGRQVIITASVALHVAAAALLLDLHDAVHAIGYELPAKYEPLHRLRGWRSLGQTVARMLIAHPGVHLMADDREDMAALIYYVHPHPFDALKWNGGWNDVDGGIHDQFDLTTDPAKYIGQDFLLVSRRSDIEDIVTRFASAGPVDHIIIPLGGGQARNYTARLLYGFKGYP
jgi:4-amino-4-deoxy-L-arabinose transferase-like glycosyltransferase